MHYCRFFTPLIAALAVSLSSNAATRVAVRAVATEEYLIKRTESSDPVQTYQFTKGRYFKPRSANKGMAEFTFDEIVFDIAQRLVEQDFYPNPTLGEGDLLIVVHYGITQVGESLQELMAWTSMDDMGLNDTAGSSVASLANAANQLEFIMNAVDVVNQSNDRGSQSTAGLLGMEEAYEGHPYLDLARETELKSMLGEERYFVILMAYDYPRIMDHGKWELQWSTRYSARAAGKRFDEAVKDMNVVAGGFFGKHLDRLASKRADDTSDVDISDIEVVDTESE